MLQVILQRRISVLLLIAPLYFAGKVPSDSAMGSFFSSPAQLEPPPETAPETKNGRPNPSPTSSIETRPQKRMRPQPPSASSAHSMGAHPVDLSKYDLKTLRFTSAEAGGTGLPAKTEAELEAGGPVDASNLHVWYASYGSNLLEERFMCYIVGGKTASMNKPLAPCSDPTPPTAMEAFTVPHRLFFAYEKTMTWGQGGVSFITSKKTPDSETIIRAYRITLQQFNEVTRKENSASAPVGSVYVNPDDILQLRALDEQRFPHNAIDSRITKGKYKTIKYLGDYQGEPVLTFTASHHEQEQIASGQVPLTQPSEKYRACIVQGLVEIGISQEDAEAYVDERARTPLPEPTG